jgi:thioredoxin 1
MIKTTVLSLLFVSVLALGQVFPRVVDEKPKLLYFGATWCEPCAKMKKLFKNIDVRKELDKYDFIMYDYDRDREVSRKYKIKYLPTMVFKKGGQIIHRTEGGLSKEKLLKILQEKSS